MQDNNYWDELGVKPASFSAEDEKKFQRIDHLIHRVFEQSEEGRELLAIWAEALIMNPTAVSGLDSIGIGINEGQKTFIRSILLTIKRVEEGNS